MDECVTPANNCKFQCKNLVGSFMCICPPGYTQVGLTDDCKDINECLNEPDLCQNGQCINLQGSYRCDCFEGYEPTSDRRRCIGDFNKCLYLFGITFILDRRQGVCFRQLIHGRCTTHNRELKHVTKADCCCSMGEAWGPQCEHCPSKYSPQYQELCLDSGFTIDGQGKGDEKLTKSSFYFSFFFVPISLF